MKRAGLKEHYPFVSLRTPAEDYNPAQEQVLSIGYGFYITGLSAEAPSILVITSRRVLVYRLKGLTGIFIRKSIGTLLGKIPGPGTFIAIGYDLFTDGVSALWEKLVHPQMKRMKKVLQETDEAILANKPRWKLLFEIELTEIAGRSSEFHLKKRWFRRTVNVFDVPIRLRDAIKGSVFRLMHWSQLEAYHDIFREYEAILADAGFEVTFSKNGKKLKLIRPLPAE